MKIFCYWLPENHGLDNELKKVSVGVEKFTVTIYSPDKINCRIYTPTVKNVMTVVVGCESQATDKMSRT